MPADAAAGAHDVVVAGATFLDIVFAGLSSAPAPGTEAYADRMETCPGGVANAAVAAARLGMTTALATTFGDDAYGRWCAAVLAEVEGIDLSRSAVVDRWPTPVTVSLAYAGDRSMVTREEAAPPREPLPEGTSTRAALVDLAGLGEADDDAWWVRAARSGARLFADAGWDRTGRWGSDRLRPLEHCFAFTPNADEAMAYTRASSPERAARALAERVPLVVVTRGARGAFAVDARTGEQADVAGVDVAAVDTTGAGDVFLAALSWAQLDGLPLRESVEFAVLASAISTTEIGGAASAPCWGDIAARHARFPDDRFGFVDDLIVQRGQHPLPHRADLRTPFALLGSEPWAPREE